MSFSPFAATYLSSDPLLPTAMPFCFCSSGRSASAEDSSHGPYRRVVDSHGGPRSYPQRRARAPVPKETNPPPYEENKDEARRPLIAVDEKEVDGTESSAPSPQSSVISIPSTRVTVLSSEHTGTTLAQGSLEDGNRPPSYYSETLRSVSPLQSEDGSHPVMRGGWLDRMQRHANEKLIEDDIVP